MLRRWIAIFLLVLLPLQLSWGAVADYRQHEGSATEGHFSSQSHVHHADSDEHDPQTPAGTNDGCSTSHVCAITLPASPLTIDAVSATLPFDNWQLDRIASPPTALPERPNWFVARA